MGSPRLIVFCGYLFYPVTVIRMMMLVRIIIMVGIINVIIVRVGIMVTGQNPRGTKPQSCWGTKPQLSRTKPQFSHIDQTWVVGR